MATIVGGRGEVLATDLDAGRRRAIVDRAARAHAANVRVIEGAPDRTNLSDHCCDAIYMRTMFHHVTDPAAFARDVVRSVKPGGRIAVIDFAPGRLWFHGRDHGVTPETITSAFTAAGCTLRLRDDHWGGPTFYWCSSARKGSRASCGKAGRGAPCRGPASTLNSASKHRVPQTVELRRAWIVPPVIPTRGCQP